MRRLLACLALVGFGCHSSARLADGGTRFADGVIVDLAGGQRLADVTVCGYDDTATPACAQSDAQGSYLVDIPPEPDVLVSYRKSGYVPSLVEYHPSGSDTYLPIQSLLGADAVAHFSSAANIAIDTAGPMLILQIAVRTPGTQVTPPAQPPGDGPFYFDENGNPVSATTTTIFVAWFNGAPGIYELFVHDQIGVCAPGRFAWAGQTAGSIRARLVDGTVTRLIIDCRSQM